MCVLTVTLLLGLVGGGIDGRSGAEEADEDLGGLCEHGGRGKASREKGDAKKIEVGLLVGRAHGWQFIFALGSRTLPWIGCASDVGQRAMRDRKWAPSAPSWSRRRRARPLSRVPPALHGGGAPIRPSGTLQRAPRDALGRTRYLVAIGNLTVTSSIARQIRSLSHSSATSPCLAQSSLPLSSPQTLASSPPSASA